MYETLYRGICIFLDTRFFLDTRSLDTRFLSRAREMIQPSHQFTQSLTRSVDERAFEMERRRFRSLLTCLISSLCLIQEVRSTTTRRIGADWHLGIRGTFWENV